MKNGYLFKFQGIGAALHLAQASSGLPVSFVSTWEPDYIKPLPQVPKNKDNKLHTVSSVSRYHTPQSTQRSFFGACRDLHATPKNFYISVYNWFPLKASKGHYCLRTSH